MAYCRPADSIQSFGPPARLGGHRHSRAPGKPHLSGGGGCGQQHSRLLLLGLWLSAHGYHWRLSPGLGCGGPGKSGGGPAAIGVTGTGARPGSSADRALARAAGGQCHANAGQRAGTGRQLSGYPAAQCAGRFADLCGGGLADRPAAGALGAGGHGRYQRPQHCSGLPADHGRRPQQRRRGLRQRYQ